MFFENFCMCINMCMELNLVDDNFVLNIDKIDIMYIDCEIVCCLLD